MVKEEKKGLRTKLLRQMLSLTKEEIRRRSEYVGRILSTLPLYRKAKCIMGYFPLKGEVDVLEIMRKAEGKKFCFPVMDLKAHTLRAFLVDNLTDGFVKGPYGVSQPDVTKAHEVTMSAIDMILIPGLAFDHQKHRLGRGAGFYDRFLKNACPPTLKVGIAFKFQIVDRLPVYLPFDEQVDIVVSEDFFI